MGAELRAISAGSLRSQTKLEATLTRVHEVRPGSVRPQAPTFPDESPPPQQEGRGPVETLEIYPRRGIHWPKERGGHLKVPRPLVCGASLRPTVGPGCPSNRQPAPEGSASVSPAHGAAASRAEWGFGAWTLGPPSVFSRTTAQACGPAPWAAQNALPVLPVSCSLSCSVRSSGSVFPLGENRLVELREFTVITESNLDKQLPFSRPECVEELTRGLKQSVNDAKSPGSPAERTWSPSCFLRAAEPWVEGTTFTKTQVLGSA